MKENLEKKRQELMKKKGELDKKKREAMKKSNDIYNSVMGFDSSKDKEGSQSAGKNGGFLNTLALNTGGTVQDESQRKSEE